MIETDYKAKLHRASRSNLKDRLYGLVVSSGALIPDWALEGRITTLLDEIDSHINDAFQKGMANGKDGKK